jgi:hypothetical protein
MKNCTLAWLGRVVIGRGQDWKTVATVTEHVIVIHIDVEAVPE